MTPPEAAEIDMTDAYRFANPGDGLSYHEQMLDAQSRCVSCKLCGGRAVISDAGEGAGYYIRCENSRSFRSSKGCLISDRRLGGWAYNVMDWWNRLHAIPTPDFASGVSMAAGEYETTGGLGPNSHVIGGAFIPIEYLVGENIYIMQGDALIVMDQPMASQLGSALTASRVPELTAALRPFAVLGKMIGGAFGPALFPDDKPVEFAKPWAENGEPRVLTFGDLRRAAAAFALIEETE